MGGSDEFDKGVRRYGVPGLILVNALLSSLWLGIASYPLMVGTLSIGYGESSAIRKFCGGNNMLTRALIGFFYGLSALPILWGNWYLLAFHIIALVIWVALNGSQKFKFDAVIEEGGMGLLFSICPILIGSYLLF